MSPETRALLPSDLYYIESRGILSVKVGRYSSENNNSQCFLYPLSISLYFIFKGKGNMETYFLYEKNRTESPQAEPKAIPAIQI